jgi:hypothetical protein
VFFEYQALHFNYFNRHCFFASWLQQAIFCADSTTSRKFHIRCGRQSNANDSDASCASYDHDAFTSHYDNSADPDSSSASRAHTSSNPCTHYNDNFACPPATATTTDKFQT